MGAFCTSSSVHRSQEHGKSWLPRPRAGPKDVVRHPAEKKKNGCIFLTNKWYCGFQNGPVFPEMGMKRRCKSSWGVNRSYNLIDGTPLTATNNDTQWPNGATLWCSSPFQPTSYSCSTPALAFHERVAFLRTVSTCFTLITEDMFCCGRSWDGIGDLNPAGFTMVLLPNLGSCRPGIRTCHTSTPTRKWLAPRKEMRRHGGVLVLWKIGKGLICWYDVQYNYNN